MANGFRVANREYVFDHCSYTIHIGSKYVRTTNISENGVKLEKRHDYCFTAYMEEKNGSKRTDKKRHR